MAIAFRTLIIEGGKMPNLRLTVGLAMIIALVLGCFVLASNNSVKDQIIGQEFALKAVTIDGQVVEIGKATVSQANILCWPWGCSGTAKGKTTLFPGMKVTDTGLQVLMAINNDPLLIKRFDLEPPPGILYLEFEYTGQ